jgi:hypothetical protein
MRFLLSDLQQARFPDAIADGREIFFPGGRQGTIEQCDGIFFHTGQDLCINLHFWILNQGKLWPIDEVEIAFEPGATNRQTISPTAIELFNINRDLTYAGLHRAITQAAEPLRVAVPQGCEEFRQYFQRHEAFCHELKSIEPNVMWRAYFNGAIPDGFTGFEADYNSIMSSKMVAYGVLEGPVDPPEDLFVWMADYARRRGTSDATSVREGSAVHTKLLVLPVTSGPITPRYPRDVMSLLMANPERQTTALVLFALTDGVSAVWQKPQGFDQWLLSTCVEP